MLTPFSHAVDSNEQKYTNASGGTWGHIQPRYYSSEGEEKTIYTFLFNDMAAILNFLTSLRLFIIYT